MTELFTALALVLVIEGLFLALFPHHLPRLLAMIEKASPESLRMGGLAAATVGVAAVWLLRG